VVYYTGRIAFSEKGGAVPNTALLKLDEKTKLMWIYEPKFKVSYISVAFDGYEPHCLAFLDDEIVPDDNAGANAASEFISAARKQPESSYSLAVYVYLCAKPLEEALRVLCDAGLDAADCERIACGVSVAELDAFCESLLRRTDIETLRLASDIPEQSVKLYSVLAQNDISLNLNELTAYIETIIER